MKVLLACLSAAQVLACNQTVEQVVVAPDLSATTIQSNQTPATSSLPIPTQTPTQIPPPSIPTLADTPIPTPTCTITPTPVCFHLLNPPDGSSLPGTGRVEFEWETHPGAQKYLLEITAPDGHMLAFETFNVGMEYYLNLLPWEGVYTWRVAAMNAEGGVLCIVGPFGFSKPRFKPSPIPDKNPLLPPRKIKPSQGGG